MPILPTIPTTEAVVNALTAPVKKLLGFAAKNVMEPQGRPTKEVLTDLVKGDNPSFYKKQTVDGGNEIDTFLYNIPYSTENTSNVGPSYDEYLQKNFPTKKHNVKTYNAHFGDTLYIDQNYKRQVLDELEQGKTVGAHAGMYANAPSKIVSKNEEGRPYDAGGHLMQFSYDEDGNVVANMSDIYDFYPKDFKESYSRRAHGAITLGGLYALHHLGTPFIVRQNNIPVVFKDFNSIPSENLSSSQQKLKEYLNKFHLSSSSLSKPLSDEQIEEIFTGKNDSEIFDSMKQKGYFIFKKGGRIHIKKENRGKFTEYCGGKVTQECIVKGKNSKDPKIRKRATFAANARKWKHEDGGILKALDYAQYITKKLD